MAECRVGGRSILVCQVAGQYYALDGECSHAAQRLCTGRLNGFEVLCPLHRARFDVRTGAPTAGPATAPLATYPVILDSGKVHVMLDG